MRRAFSSLVLLLAWLAWSSPSVEASPPNILWITSEDNAAHWMGCYGNSDAHTPRLDALAGRGLLFSHAYSNAPVCAVARATILHGAYAVTTGTQHMRSRHRVPQVFRPYVEYLRERGYYTTNNAKTDYNRRGDDRAIWDECSNRAHYKRRAKDQPFFAIFNLTVCHESSLFPEVVARNRRQGTIPESPRVDPEALTLPPYVPDLPEVRQDFAIYHDNLTAMDKRAGELLEGLEERGLADDTIVFYYGDHGGPTPRGKRYLADTGVRVPLLVYLPPRWQHLSPFGAGETVTELVSFVDLAPTLLSLCGIEKPAQMQGRAFLGQHRTDPADDDLVLLYGDRFDEIIGMRRGITDGRFKYIRRFMPHLPAAPYSYYQFSMPSWIAWREAWRQGTLTGVQRQIWEAPQTTEMLFDTTSDPWEINNLAGQQQHADRLAAMRRRLRQTMLRVGDTGVIPEAMFDQLAGERTIYEHVQSRPEALARQIDLAFLASEQEADNLPALVAALDDSDPVVRYWGALGLLILGDRASSVADELRPLLEDPQPAVRFTAAQALHAVGETDLASSALISELDKPLSDDAALHLVNAITQVDALAKIPDAWVERTLADDQANEYVKRLARRLKDSR